MKVIDRIQANSTPNATKSPNTCTGGIGASAREANPTAVVRDVYSIGVNSVSITPVMVFRGSLVSWYRSKNSDRM